MAACHGRVLEFDGNADEWTVYAERLKHYFATNDVDSAVKQRAILLSGCGASTYKLMKSLVAPNALETKSFKELVDLVQLHIHSKPSAIVSRFRFNSCVRQHSKSVATYVVRLRQLTEYCEYGTSLEEMLRDRVVCGIQDERLQRRLLAEPDLTFKKAFDIAQAYESAESNAKALRTSQPAEVHATKMSDRSGASFQDTPCYRCGGRHRAADCRFRDAICNHCSKKGHIARACRSRNRSAEHQPLQSGKPSRSKPQTANCLTQEAE